MVGFGTRGVETSGSAAILLVSQILGKYVVRMGDGWNWFRIVSNGG
jgi:hypothetical protein